MALRPGSGGGSGSGFMFPVSGGLIPPQGMTPMQHQQQGFPMVPVMQPNMQGMMGMNFGSQMPPGSMSMQGGMAMGSMPPTGMPYMPQHHYVAMRPSPPQYTPDMRKQLAGEQQKLFEQQQKIMEEERKRRQFEEQKQKLRLLSSVKPKMGEKNRDDALEAIKGNLAGFSRDAKMHPGPTSHSSKPDIPQSSLSTAPPSQSPAFSDDEEFSDFVQGPDSAAPAVPTSFQPRQPFHPTLESELQSELAAAPTQPVTSVHPKASSALYASAGHSTKSSKGLSLEEKMFASCDFSMPKQAHIKFNTSEPMARIGSKASVSTQFQPSAKACNWGIESESLSGVFAADMPKDPEPELPAKDSGVGVHPSQETLQPMLSPWLFNDSLVPELYKKVLEVTLTPVGIDTAKLYPILLSSGLPREMLGQIWAFANRATPGKLTKEELYTVLAMIAMSQRGIPAMNLENLNQLSTAPVPTLSALPVNLPPSVPQQPIISVPSGPSGSLSVQAGQSVVGMDLAAPVGGSTVPVSSSFVASFSSSQVGKLDDDDFQDFQEAPKPNAADDSFKGFKSEVPGTLSKAPTSQTAVSAHTLLTPISGTSSSSVDKYAVFKDLTEDKSAENSSFTDLDDFKFDPFGNFGNGSAVSSLTSYDWSEREDSGSQTKKQPPFFNSEGKSSSSTSVLQRKETSFGSSENITMTTVSTVTTFSAEDESSKSKFDAFGDFKETAEQTKEIKQRGNDFGDFAITSSREGEGAVPNVEGSAVDNAGQKSDDPVTNGVVSEETKTEAFDEFGEFQSEKPKISKFDFLMASSQSKMKSSEEMIKSEMETFDLSVQGSHKRSLSLGDKEVTRAPPFSEQAFRDRSNTLNEKPAAPLPVIRDKYKDLTGEVEENERYAYEWQRCLESALQVINKASETLNGISSSAVCSEVIQSTQGMEYLLGVIEVYRVTKRVELGIKATAVSNEKLQLLIKEIERIWSSLMIFMSLTPLTPDENSLDFSSCILRPGIKNAKELACGVCLLNVDSRSKNEENVEDHPKHAFNSESDNFKLSYGGHQYHASCANFWINCVEPKPPGLILPDLL
ncbi:synergin gamma isoform X9 [Narcine bancroftii]|uniref:synergin gamma isoform X9 n=1 Tax=Narcine bancroftii TaxID=1343680 RepID=UPI0038317259